jgi:hypothetical protein
VKPGKPLRRRTALRPGGPLVRKAELKRKAGLKRRAFKASVPVMSPEEKAAKDTVRERSGGVCEIQVPGLCWGRALDFSHRIREGQGGPWSPRNGLDACRACHEWTHRYPSAARVKRWALKANELDMLDRPVLYRGAWALLGEDGSVTPTRRGAAA